MPLVEGIDSFFKYVKGRIIAQNSNRLVVGILEASAWPPKQFEPNAFYLLNLGETSPKGFGTVSSRGIVHLVQWVWIIVGDDLPQQRTAGENRGNRYRINYQMKNELLYGLFPNFCTKNSYSAQQNGNQIVTSATDTGDKILWSAPRWIPTKFQGKTGVMYGAAQVYVSQFSDVITS